QLGHNLEGAAGAVISTRENVVGGTSGGIEDDAGRGPQAVGTAVVATGNLGQRSTGAGVNTDSCIEAAAASADEERRGLGGSVSEPHTTAEGCLACWNGVSRRGCGGGVFDDDDSGQERGRAGTLVVDGDGLEVGRAEGGNQG